MKFLHLKALGKKTVPCIKCIKPYQSMQQKENSRYQDGFFKYLSSDALHPELKIQTHPWHDKYLVAI
jgi:hypothetical protein